MNIQLMKDFLNITNIPDKVIQEAINDAKLFLIRKKIDIPKQLTKRGRPSKQPITDSENILSAWKYLTAYFLLPQISVIYGQLGVTKQIGMGDQTQHLLSEADIERKQAFYYDHAMRIVDEILLANYPFGIDI